MNDKDKLIAIANGKTQKPNVVMGFGDWCRDIISTAPNVVFIPDNYQRLAMKSALVSQFNDHQEVKEDMENETQSEAQEVEQIEEVKEQEPFFDQAPLEFENPFDNFGWL